MKAISPVLAVLMMIAVAIAGSLVTYAWVMGYIGFSTEKAGKAIMIQSVANINNNTDLVVYVQNVGEGVVELDPESSLYVNGELKNCTITPDVLVGKGDTATLFLANGAAGPGEKFTVKVTTLMGTFTEKSDYPASTTGGAPIVPPTPALPVERVKANDAGFGTTTAGNLLVVIAGHRTGDPGTDNEPTITDWERREVAYYYEDSGDRRIVALFTKIATGSEDTVSVTWGGGASSYFTLYQEFTGATTYTPIPGGSGVNSEGESTNIWATSPMVISGLSDPSGENILTIGAAVWRDNGPLPTPPYDGDISSVGFTNLSDGGVGPVAQDSGCTGASAFSYGSAVTETEISWNGANTDDMVSGLLIQFACS